MFRELQSLVDDVAKRLDAPIALEDHEQRMVVYSSHSHAVDEVRRDSILRRETSPEVIAWFRRFGILQANGPLRIPSHPERGILGRLCVPVRYQGRLMGFLWLIDDEERLDVDAVAVAVKAAEHAGLLLYEEELSQRLASSVLSHLLSSSEDLRAMSALQIVDEAMFPAHAPGVVVVVQPADDVHRDIFPRVSEALRDLGWECGTDEVLRLARQHHGVLLVRVRSMTDDGKAAAVAQAARRALVRRLGDGSRVIAALGDPQPQLATAVLSYRQARLAAKVAAVVPGMGDLPRWRDLGAFRALAQLPPGEAAEWALDPRVSALFRAGDHEIIETLETYLDLGCDAKATAERLHLHRGTLYYRLEKAQRITGANLRDGNDRLAIHLGFKLSWLTGLHPASEKPR